MSGATAMQCATTEAPTKQQALPTAAPGGATQAKRKKRTKAQIAADKQVELEEKSRILELENSLKEKLDRRVTVTEERDKVLVAQRHADLIHVGRRPTTTPSEQPIEEDDMFSAVAPAPVRAAGSSHGNWDEGSDGEDFQLALRELDLESDSSTDSELGLTSSKVGSTFFSICRQH